MGKEVDNMSSQKTEHYGLNLWEPQDSFLRTEFNENSEATDAALASKYGADNEPWSYGVYTGDGESEQFISLGFTPRLVIVTGGYLSFGVAIHTDERSASFESKSVASGDGGVFFSSGYLSIREGGFAACTYSYGFERSLNRAGYSYCWFAVK